MIPLHEYENIRVPLTARIRELEEQLEATERQLELCRMSIAALGSDERVEALEAGLRSIVEMPINETATAGWHFAEVRRIARVTLAVSNPAFGPRIQSDSDPSEQVSGASPEGDDGDTGAEESSPASEPDSPWRWADAEGRKWKAVSDE